MSFYLILQYSKYSFINLCTQIPGYMMRNFLITLSLLLYSNSGWPETISATETAIFAGGCFWCMEPPFDELDGVISTTSGYTGGKETAPDYKSVSSGRTGHTEAVSIEYDPAKVDYQTLLEVFWKNHDPTTANRQFCDYGFQYRPAIFYLNQKQKELAEHSKIRIEKTKSFKEPVVTEITMASDFYIAEEYHQDYYRKNPVRYKFYRYGCGRDKRLQELWGK